MQTGKYTQTVKSAQKIPGEVVSSQLNEISGSDIIALLSKPNVNIVIFLLILWNIEVKQENKSMK